MRFQNRFKLAIRSEESPRVKIAISLLLIRSTVTALLLIPILATSFSSSASAQISARPLMGRTLMANRPRMSRVAPVESENFIVYANDAILAKKVSTEAERFRRELAIKWLGKELPRWQGKCPIKVELERNAGGETSFAFIQDRSGTGTPIDWSMKIFGPPDRLLDAVLPHEVTHTIFATHFGRPLPRWADEGACTTVEHKSERDKNHNMLMEFLKSQPSRGIPFNRMFTMRNYPHDILPLYAQGYSLARFLIMKKGHRTFVDYVGRGMDNEGRLETLRAWDQATSEFYDYKDLSDLQIDWLSWVKAGSKNENLLDPSTTLLASASSKSSSSNQGSQRIPSVYQINAKSLGEGIDGEGSLISSFDASQNYRTRPLASLSTQGKGYSSQGSSFKEAEPAGTWATESKSKSEAVAPSTYASSNLDSQSNSNYSSGSWYIREMKKSKPAATVANNSLSSNRTRKVPSSKSANTEPPVHHDSRLPSEFRTVSPTLWR